jgi:hypothetical protein
MSAAGETRGAGGRAPLEPHPASAARIGGVVRLPETQGRAGAAEARAPSPSSGARATVAEVVRALGGLALVMAVVSTALWALDGVPTFILGEPRGVRKARTVQDAERFLRARLVLPSYFPASFAWPPSRIRFVTGAPGAVALSVDGRNGGPGLFLAETVGPGSIPPRLLPEGQLLDRSPVALGALRGTLSRVVEGGVVVWEIAWQQGGRSMLLRSRGSADELVRMARSAKEAP